MCMPLDLWEGITSVDVSEVSRLITSDGVCWMPYGDHRVVREFELISLFFGHI